MDHRSTVGVLAAVAALLLAAPAPATVKAALPARGNAPVAGPSSADLERVTVSRTPTGELTFFIRLSAPVSLAGTRVQVMLDTDRSAATGIEGSEFALDYSAAAGGGAPYASLLSLRDWQLVETRPVSLRFAKTASSLTFRIAAAAIGNPSSFDFWIFTARDGTVVDTLPAAAHAASGQPAWTYGPGTGAVSYADAGQGSVTLAEVLLAGIALAATIGAILIATRGVRRESVAAPPPAAPLPPRSARRRRPPSALPHT